MLRCLLVLALTSLSSMAFCAIPRYYIGALDLVDYDQGLFLVKFYSACDKFKYYDAIHLKAIRASKTGVYFLDRDIVKIEVKPTPPEDFKDQARAKK